MKHYKEGRFALIHVVLASVSLFIFLLLFNELALAQIPINGFCRFDSFKTEEGFNNFLALNYNNDSYTDVLFFEKNSKNLAACKGQGNASFSIDKVNKLHCDISQVKLFQNKIHSGTLYAFIARKERVAGIMKISENGTASILYEKVVDSYPDNLCVADINHDGNNEILISGGAFNGISILSLNKNELSERKIFDKKVFSHLVIADLNNDSYPDIAGFDLLSTSIRFFYNNSLGDFYEVRQFRLDGKISLLMAYDFNLDNIQDLIYVRDHQIYFLFGDNRAAFNNSFSIQVENNVDNLAIGDFNHDGMLDIAYLSIGKSVLSIIFSKEHNRFNPEIPFLSKGGLTKIIPFYSKYIHGLLALSNKGEYYLISEMNSIRDNVKISIGLKPYQVKYFDAGNDGISDLCFYDKAKSSLDLIVRNNAGVPSRFYSISLMDTCSELEIDDSRRNIKSFYCFSKGKKLVEIITVDLQKKVINKDKIYSSGPIMDLKIKREEEDNKPVIYILSGNRANLRLYCYRYSNFRYTSTSSGNISSNVIQAALVFNNPLTIYYWKRDKKSFTFNKILVNSNLDFQESNAKYVLPVKNNMEIFNFTGDIYNNDNNEALSFIFTRNSKIAISSFGNKCFKLDLKGSLQKFSMCSGSHVCSMENPSNGLNELFIYNNFSGALEKFDLLNKERILLGKKIVETKNLESYFVKSLSSDKYHLVYTDKAENCIIIKEIYL